MIIMKKVIVILLSVMIVGVSGCGEKLEEKQVTTEIITEEMPESTITEEKSSTTELVNKAELKPVKKDNQIETGGTLENNNVETETPTQEQDTSKDSQITDDQPEIAADQPDNTTSEKESSETTEITEKPNTTETSFVGYSPEDVVNLAIAKCTANGKITTEQNLDNLLSSGQITQDECNEYYPLDGLDDSYFSVYVNKDLNKAATTSGSPLSSENEIAGYVAELISLESGSVFNIRYTGTYDTGGETFYEFRCYR